MANKTLNATIIVRGGTTAEWEASNPTPKLRELCAEYRTDGTFDLKIGDGSTAWDSLPYVSTHELADLIEDTTHRTVTDAEKSTWNAKQDKLTFDGTPTSGSSNPVTSAGVYTALSKKQDTLSFDTAPTSGSKKPVTSDGIYAAINAAKTEVENEMPDTSNFITKAVSDLTNYYTKTQIDSEVSDLENKISAIPKFAIAVVTSLPTSNISSTTIYLLKTSETETGNLYTEYVYVNSTWESLGTQTLDLSGYLKTTDFNTEIANYLTETEINTAISNALASYVKTTTLTAELAKKQDKLTFDSTPTADSDNPVTSGGAYTAIAAKQNKLTFDTTPTSASTNPVTSGGVYTALSKKQGALTFDTAPKSASTNPVTSGGGIHCNSKRKGGGRSGNTRCFDGFIRRGGFVQVLGYHNN